jgi:hypothetical protein
VRWLGIIGLLLRDIFFLRLSKTGSTTLSSLIADALPPAATCPTVLQFEINAIPRDRLGAYRFFHGHIDLDYMERQFPGVAAMTVLREPKARILSAYFRWRDRVREGTVQLHETAVKAGQLALEEFLGSTDAAVQRSNRDMQARLLAGGRWGDSHFQHQQAFGPEIDDAEIVRRAKATLDRLAFVGLTERMNETVARCFTLLGLQAPLEIPLLNVTVKKDQAITSKADALLNDLTRLDRQVYDHAVALFEARRERLNDAVGGGA